MAGDAADAAATEPQGGEVRDAALVLGLEINMSPKAMKSMERCCPLLRSTGRTRCTFERIRSFPAAAARTACQWRGAGEE